MVEGTECQGPKAGMSFCLSQEEKEWGGQVDDGGNRFREMTGAHSQASEAHTAWLDSQLTKDTQSQTPVPCSTFPRREDRQCTFLPLPSFSSSSFSPTFSLVPLLGLQEHHHTWLLLLFLLFAFASNLLHLFFLPAPFSSSPLSIP